jgi:hypothetical protein
MRAPNFVGLTFVPRRPPIEARRKQGRQRSRRGVQGDARGPVGIAVQEIVMGFAAFDFEQINRVLAFGPAPTTIRVRR